MMKPEHGRMVMIWVKVIRSVRREAGCDYGRLISTDLILGFLSSESDQTDLIIFEKKKMLGGEWSGEDEGRKTPYQRHASFKVDVPSWRKEKKRINCPRIN